MTEINIAYFNGSKRKNGSTNKVILSFINQLKENVNLNINTYDLSYAPNKIVDKNIEL